MQTLNIHEIQAHLLQFGGVREPLIITQSGKPIAQIVPYTEKPTVSRRIGFLQNIHVPDDFDAESEEINALFAGADDEILA